MLKMGSYAARRARRPANPVYVARRAGLEQHWPDGGLPWEMVANEPRLWEAMRQAMPEQQLNMLECRIPWTVERLRVLEAATRRASPSLPQLPEPSSLEVEPSLSTQPPTMHQPPSRAPVQGPRASPRPAGAPAAGDVERYRPVIQNLASNLGSSHSRELAYELGLPIGTVDGLKESSRSVSEFTRSVVVRFLSSPCLHREDPMDKLLTALRRMNLNMTADNLSDLMDFEGLR
ncbi:uncharacterized protein LOC119112904 [Pollicipes pollicipes]|uniref:uncharacterized protein LOC119112904 n=1 Tax=Pollicipes pollicipes TaxID=41117 RepID=UPI0018851A7B|nr:uncharacterized protein LOC119112904 [Pollicipes pollicipes]XP_037093106.1 uncharacterized protein LOC119112904 [Pollicipes pollicipes]